MKKLFVLFLLVLAFGTYSWFKHKPKPPVTPIPPVAIPVFTVMPQTVAPSADPRIAALTAFFTKYKCPELSFDLIPDYLNAADKNNLNYRILPAISVQESSCGRHYPVLTNNLWGWDSARTSFPSLREGLNFVAERLANGYYYKGKTLDQILHAYNPNALYAPKIKALTKEIAP